MVKVLKDVSWIWLQRSRPSRRATLNPTSSDSESNLGNADMESDDSEDEAESDEEEGLQEWQDQVIGGEQGPSGAVEFASKDMCNSLKEVWKALGSGQCIGCHETDQT